MDEYNSIIHTNPCEVIVAETSSWNFDLCGFASKFKKDSKSSGKRVIQQVSAIQVNNKQSHKFKLLNVSEFKKFLSIVLYIGLVKVPNIMQMWSDSIIHQPFVSKLMSRDRFLEL